MRTLILATALLISASASAQREEKDLNPQDPKAQQILDALSSKAEGYSSFQADFEYTLVNKTEGINETQKGRVTMKGRTKYKLDIAGQVVSSDGESVCTLIKAEKELQISDIPEENEEDGNLMNPSNAFHMYKKGFKYMYDGTGTVDGQNVEIIKMYPMKPEGKNYHTIMVNVNTEKMELVSMEVKGKDGNTYTYKLKNFKANIPVTDSDFKCPEDQADDIIDLRE